MSSSEAVLMISMLLAILLPIAALVGVVFAVRFFIRLSRCVEQISRRLDAVAESLAERATPDTSEDRCGKTGLTSSST